MYFPVLILGLRRLGRWAVYEVLQLALWVAFGLQVLVSLRSAFGGGGELGPRRPGGRAIRPRRSAGAGRFAHSAAA